MYGILIGDDFGLTRDEVMKQLRAVGIETRSFFVSMHRQPALAKYGCDVSGNYPVTDDLARRGAQKLLHPQLRQGHLGADHGPDGQAGLRGGQRGRAGLQWSVRASGTASQRRVYAG